MISWGMNPFLEGNTGAYVSREIPSVGSEEGGWFLRLFLRWGLFWLYLCLLLPSRSLTPDVRSPVEPWRADNNHTHVLWWQRSGQERLPFNLLHQRGSKVYRSWSTLATVLTFRAPVCVRLWARWIFHASVWRFLSGLSDYLYTTSYFFPFINYQGYSCMINTTVDQSLLSYSPWKLPWNVSFPPVIYRRTINHLHLYSVINTILLSNILRSIPQFKSSVCPLVHVAHGNMQRHILLLRPPQLLLLIPYHRSEINTAGDTRRRWEGAPPPVNGAFGHWMCRSTRRFACYQRELKLLLKIKNTNKHKVRSRLVETLGLLNQ